MLPDPDRIPPGLTCIDWLTPPLLPCRLRHRVETLESTLCGEAPIAFAVVAGNGCEYPGAAVRRKAEERGLPESHLS